MTIICVKNEIRKRLADWTGSSGPFEEG